jgi:hypothetical protein
MIAVDIPSWVKALQLFLEYPLLLVATFLIATARIKYWIGSAAVPEKKV